MDLLPSIDKVSGSNIDKGLYWEKRFSGFIHQQGCPLLCSSLVLREYGMGQCDLVRYHRRSHFIEIFEIKSHEQLPVFFMKQSWRIHRAANFLGEIFKANVKVTVLHKEDFAKFSNLH